MSLVELCTHGDLEGVKATLQCGTDVNRKEKNGGWTGLMYAVHHNHNSVVALLLNTPAIDVNWMSDRGTCALHQAVYNKNNEGLKLLLNFPTIDVNIVKNDGYSALHSAVLSENNEGLKMLLNVPTIDVNIVGDDNASAVHWAVRNNNIEMLKLLLSHQRLTAFTLNLKDKLDGDTPVMRAVMLKKEEHLALLAADPRVDLETTEKEGRSLEEMASKRWIF